MLSLFIRYINDSRSIYEGGDTTHYHLTLTCEPTNEPSFYYTTTSLLTSHYYTLTALRAGNTPYKGIETFYFLGLGLS